MVDFSGIGKKFGFLATFPRGTPWKKAKVLLEKESSQQPLKGKLKIAPDQQAYLALWQPDQINKPIDLSVLDQFQSDDLVFLLIITNQVSAKELKRLQRHKALHYLHIGHLQKVENKDLLPLTKMKWLQRVRISGPGIANKTLPVLQELPNAKGKGLTSLSFYGEHVSEKQLKQLKLHPNLQRLLLGSTNITDEDLVHLKGLTELRHLSLPETNITGHGLRHLAGLKKLKRLYLREAALTDEGMAGIQSLVSLKQLNLAHTKITDKALQHLANLEHLHTLAINGTKVHGQGFQYLSGLDQLETLLARGTPLEDEALKHLQKLESLKILDIPITPISDKGLMYLSKVPNLKSISIGSTKVTDQGIRRFKKKKPNVKVYVGMALS